MRNIGNVVISSSETKSISSNNNNNNNMKMGQSPVVGGGGGGYNISIISRPTKLLLHPDHHHHHHATPRIVESMRASSPTPTPTTIKHSMPSALDMFDKIIDASKGKQIVMFLDYDGTLSPIVDDPDRAFMSHSMRKTVKKVAKSFPTAIVSGRRLDKVYGFVRLGELYYAGSHGMDIKGPTKDSNYKKCAQSVLFQPASEFLPMIDEVYKQLVQKTKSTPGAMVENNKFCLSVHFRCVQENKWSELAQKVKSVLKNFPQLRLTQGRKVLEIRPTIKWDKGKALEFLLESLGFSNCSDVFPVYIGDDRTDEDAFKVQPSPEVAQWSTHLLFSSRSRSSLLTIIKERGQGFGILVSKFPKETSASYSLREPSEVMYFLERLADWKNRRPLEM